MWARGQIVTEKRRLFKATKSKSSQAKMYGSRLWQTVRNRKCQQLDIKHHRLSNINCLIDFLWKVDTTVGKADIAFIHHLCLLPCVPLGHAAKREGDSPLDASKAFFSKMAVCRFRMFFDDFFAAHREFLTNGLQVYAGVQHSKIGKH